MIKKIFKNLIQYIIIIKISHISPCGLPIRTASPTYEEFFTTIVNCTYYCLSFSDGKQERIREVDEKYNQNNR